MSRLIRWPSLLLAYLFLVLALVGIVVPGLPTVPFLLLTAWFAARGSGRLHRWLYAHPHLGAMLINWEQQGAVSRRSKYLALLLLAISWSVMYLKLTNLWLLAGLTLLFASVAIFLLTRPEPR